MADVLSFLGTCTIANGGTESNVLSSNLLASAKAIIIRAPSALTGTVTVKGHPKKDQLIAACAPIRNADLAADYTVVAAKEMHINGLSGLKSLALLSSGAEGAERVFQVYIVHEL